MQLVSIPDSNATLIAPAGNRDFFHFRNDTGTTIWLKYDGSPDDLTPDNGIPVADGEMLMLNNDGVKPIFTKEIWAIQTSGVGIAIRVHGV